MSGGKPTGRCNKLNKCWCTKSIEERLQHFLPELKLLSEASPLQRANILRNASTCLTRLLCETGLNILKGHVKLSDDQYKKIRPHKRLLLMVSKPSIPLKHRREALAKKKGGFLPIVLPAILSAISGFAGQTLSKIIASQ